MTKCARALASGALAFSPPLIPKNDPHHTNHSPSPKSQKSQSNQPPHPRPQIPKSQFRHRPIPALNARTTQITAHHPNPINHSSDTAPSPPPTLAPHKSQPITQIPKITVQTSPPHPPKSQKSQFRQPYTNRRHIVQVAIQATPTTIRPLATVPKTVQSTAAAPPALPFPPALPHYPLSTIPYPLQLCPPFSPCAIMPVVFTCIIRKRELAGILACAIISESVLRDVKGKLARLLACAIMAELTLNDSKLGWRNAAYRRTPAKHVAANHHATSGAVENETSGTDPA